MREYFPEALVLFGWDVFDVWHKYIIGDRNLFGEHQPIVQSYTTVSLQMSNQHSTTMILNSWFWFFFQFITHERS